MPSTFSLRSERPLRYPNVIKLRKPRHSEEPQATKNLRISLTYKVKSVRRSFDSLTLAQDDTPN